MKLAIYGAGSLGIILGAYLTKAGLSVDLINRNRNQIEALRKNGAKVTGTVEMTQPVNALLPEEMSEVYDVIFLMTKQLDNPAVASFLKPFLREKGILCTMQNGLPEPALAEILGEDRVMGAAVSWGATLLGPGISELTSEPDSMTFAIGRLNGKMDEKAREVKAILGKMCPTQLEENFIGGRWSKLLINCTFSGLSAVFGCTFGEVAQNKATRRCALYTARECIEAARAEGVRFEPVQGFQIERLLYFRGAIGKARASFVLPIAVKKHSRLKASMLQDLEKGKKCEVDAINGVVCSVGRKHHIATPFNDAIVKVIHQIESGDAKPGKKNLMYFSKL